MSQTIIAPQPGPQQMFLASQADICLYGGAAGGGKSYALLLETLRHWENPKFNCIIFRKNSTQIRNQGGLWNEAESIFRPLGCHLREGLLEVIFPSGAKIKFAHMEHDKTIYAYQGSQIPAIFWDELTHFSETQFFYMMSRLRSTSGVAGYVRATCNPDSDSWVAKFVDWYIDEEGYPIPERSGTLRWFIRQDEKLIWAETKEELEENYGKDTMPKSFTFISSKLSDNKILMEKDPTYLASLKSLSRIERMRLLGGNWKVRPSAGAYFQRESFEILDAIPSGWMQEVRYWDRAATKPSESNPDPDWTRGIKMLKYPNGMFLITCLRSARDTPLKIEQLIKNTASHDGHNVKICLEQDPGSSGVADAQNYVRLLAGYYVQLRSPSKDKLTRALPLSAQCEFGNVKLLRAPWNEEFFMELENFSGEDGKGHDDIVDATSGAFNELCGEISVFDTYS